MTLLFSLLWPLIFSLASSQEFKNYISPSNTKCNSSGYEQYVRNGDVSHTYDVTVEVKIDKPGGASITEMLVVNDIPPGGKKLVGCTISTSADTLTYKIVAEKIK
jgi:hypothetical protein